MGVLDGGAFNQQGVWYVCRFSPQEKRATQEKDTQTGAPLVNLQTKTDPKSAPTKKTLSEIPAQECTRVSPTCHHITQHCCNCAIATSCRRCFDLTSGKMDEEGDVIVSADITPIKLENGDESKLLNGSDMGSPGGDSSDQLAMVEDMVLEMKAGFVTVLDELSKIQFDEKQQKEWIEKANGYENQIKDLTETVNSLKDELKEMSQQMKKYGEEKDILLMELQRNGQLSDYCKEKLNLKTEATTPQSDFDSGVNLAHQCGSWVGGGTSPPGIAPMVKPFMESLTTGGNEGKSSADHYDSDSVSVTALANRSLQLSETLRAKYQEMSSRESSNDDDPNSSFEETLTRREMNSASRYQVEGNNNENQFNDQAFNEKQRQRLTAEILSSERKYCSTLWTLIDDYISPLRQMNLFTSRDLNLIFPPYITQMYAQHCSILRKLEDRVLNWRWNGIVGDIFAKLTDTQENDLLSLYRDYVSDFPTALSNMNKWRLQSHKFSAFLKNHHHGRGSEVTDVTALLLSPVQRIAQYVLLIKELLKYTDNNHSDRYYLVASLAILRNFLNQLNEETQHAVQLVEDGARTRRSSRSAPSIKSSGSSSDVNHVLSARDSGIHSTGEDLVKMHQSPPPRHLVSLRNRRSDDHQVMDRSDPYSRRMRLVSSQSNINRSAPGGNQRPQSPYVTSMNNRPRSRDRQRRNQGRKTMDSFPMVQSMSSHRTASPSTRHAAVPRLQLDEFFDPVMEPNEPRSYREPSIHQRPHSVVGRSCIYEDFEMNRLAQLAQNRPRSVTEELILREEMFHTDAEAKLQHMLNMEENNKITRVKTGGRSRDRLSLTPDEEYYGHRAEIRNRTRELRKLAGIDHLIESGLLMRAQSPNTLHVEEQLTQDYGIYGDNDDVDDDQAGPTSLPPMPDTTDAEFKHREQMSKSKSQSNVPLKMKSMENLDTRLSDCPILENGLSENASDQSNVEKNVSGRDEVVSVENGMVNGQQHISTKTLLERSAHDQHVTSEVYPSNTGEFPSETVHVTSVPPAIPSLSRPDSRLAQGETPNKAQKKKARERAKLGFSTTLSKSVDDVSKAKKKNSIRDSLKNIFNKKRVDNKPYDEDISNNLVCKPEMDECGERGKSRDSLHF